MIVETVPPLGPLLAETAAEPPDGPLTVGDERVRDFLAALSKRLLDPARARLHPELAALGFFLRRGELNRLGSFTDPGGVLRHPRGLVLHFPPANVDTVFVYSWALSALAGNANIVRLSARGGPATGAILDALRETDAHPAIARTQRLVSYDRSDEITAALSLACDLRVIWGGDSSVEGLRRFPLRPSARDLAFPDRSSFAAVSSGAWAAAGPAERRRAADAFVTDSYWFDQAACSSPRTVFWVGGGSAGDRTEFCALVDEAAAARGFTTDAAMAVQKRVAAYGMAAEGAADSLRFHGNGLAAIGLTDPGRLPRHWLGAGAFAHTEVPGLASLIPRLTRKDQTLSVYGFDAAELHAFAAAAGGRGIDRIVPFGSALSFAPVWDGYDLLHEFTRLVTVRV
ncbi:acyl-CoA reductase [Actinocorallia longicatena]|uniref:Acyl-CoA reductase n=1 Tax=Actinocorallia longicatena TaxID=111803 RepID=A0ABP6QGF0_9ACTN